MNERGKFIKSITKYDTLDTKDPDFASFIVDGCPSALRRYMQRAETRIAIKKKRLERDSRFSAVLLVANRDDLPKNIWWTHETIVDFIEDGTNPEEAERVIREVASAPNTSCRLRDLLVRQLSGHGLSLRDDSKLCRAFIAGICTDPPDRVVAIAKLTAYLWTNGRAAWERHRIRLENETARLFECGAAYSWVECVHLAIKNLGFIFY